MLMPYEAYNNANGSKHVDRSINVNMFNGSTRSVKCVYRASSNPGLPPKDAANATHVNISLNSTLLLPFPTFTLLLLSISQLLNH